MTGATLPSVTEPSAHRRARTQSTLLTRCVARRELLCMCCCPSWHCGSVRACQGAALIQPGEWHYRVVPPPAQLNPGGTAFDACMGCGYEILVVHAGLAAPVRLPAPVGV